MQVDRELMQMKIEREALRKESDAASKERLAELEKDPSPTARRGAAALSARWQRREAELGAGAEDQGGA